MGANRFFADLGDSSDEDEADSLAEILADKLAPMIATITRLAGELFADRELLCRKPAESSMRRPTFDQQI